MLEEFQNLSINSSKQSFIEEYLNVPIYSFLRTEGKQFRRKVLELFSRINATEKSREFRSNVETAGTLIEWIHSASLIIDDIQDGTTTRRLAPSLHVKFGVPLALNAGNYLYFQALDLIPSLHLGAEKSRDVFQLVVRTMREAHEGQAIDIGVDVTKLNQSLVRSTCLYSIESKSGALIGCSAALGVIVSGMDDEEFLFAAQKLGKKWGMALQMYDDISHFQKSCNGELDAAKSFEDFRNKKCTWLWAVAADLLPTAIYDEFRKKIILEPDSIEIKSILDQFAILKTAIKGANSLLSSGIDEFLLSAKKMNLSILEDSFVTELKSMNAELAHSFGILNELQKS